MTPLLKIPPIRQLIYLPLPTGIFVQTQNTQLSRARNLGKPLTSSYNTSFPAFLFKIDKLHRHYTTIIAGATEQKDGQCGLELLDQKVPDRVYFFNEDTPEMTKLSDPDLQESKPVPWRRTYGLALNGQIVDNWFFCRFAFSLVLYSVFNQSFAVQAKDFRISGAAYPVLSLFGAIAVTYAGGLLRSKDKSWVEYGILFTVAASLFVLSAALSIKDLSNYRSSGECRFHGWRCFDLAGRSYSDSGAD